jgi:carbonyl reductase 1
MPKCILITGCNKGIGFDMVKKLLLEAPEFDKVIMTARDEQRGLAAKARLGEDPRLDFYVLDISNKDSINAVATIVANTYGSIDVLMNNAGVLYSHVPGKPLLNREHLETNFYGTVNMCEAFLPLMKENSHIINISTVVSSTKMLKNQELAQQLLDPNLSLQRVFEIAEEYGALGLDYAEKGWALNGIGNYSHTKAFLNAYIRIRAKTLQDEGRSVRMNGVHPGWVKSDLGGWIAPLTAEESATYLLRVVRDSGNVTGKYWSEDEGIRDFN